MTVRDAGQCRCDGVQVDQIGACTDPADRGLTVGARVRCRVCGQIDARGDKRHVLIVAFRPGGEIRIAGNHGAGAAYHSAEAPVPSA